MLHCLNWYCEWIRYLDVIADLFIWANFNFQSKRDTLDYDKNLQHSRHLRAYKIKNFYSDKRIKNFKTDIELDVLNVEL